MPARFSALVGMTLSILAGFGALRLFRRSRSTMTGGVVLAALVAAVGFDLRPTIDLVHVWRTPPAIYSAVAGQPHAAMVEFPMQPNDENTTSNVPYLYFSIWHWTNIVNGYSGFSPPTYNQFLESFDTFPSDAALDALHAAGVTHATVNCALYGPGCQDLLDKMDAAPRLKLVASTRWEGDVARLYKIDK